VLVRDRKDIHGLALSADGKILAGSLGSTIRLWDLATGRTIRDLPGPGERGAYALAFAPGKPKVLASTCGDNTARLWDVDTGKALHPPDQPQAGVRDMFLSADGKSLLVNGDGLEVSVWDVAAGRRLGTVPHEKAGLPAGFGKDGRILLGRVGSFEATF